MSVGPIGDGALPASPFDMTGPSTGPKARPRVGVPMSQPSTRDNAPMPTSIEAPRDQARFSILVTGAFGVGVILFSGLGLIGQNGAIEARMPTAQAAVLAAPPAPPRERAPAAMIGAFPLPASAAPSVRDELTLINGVLARPHHLCQWRVRGQVAHAIGAFRAKRDQAVAAAAKTSDVAARDEAHHWRVTETAIRAELRAAAARGFLTGIDPRRPFASILAPMIEDVRPAIDRCRGLMQDRA